MEGSPEFHRTRESSMGDDRHGGVAYLAKNVGLLTISNFASNILVFLLVPLYTAVLTTGEYGTYDLINTTVNLLVPILTANIAESVLRFALDDVSDNGEVLSIGALYTIASIFLVCVVVIALVTMGVGDGFLQWLPFFLGLYVAQALSRLVSYYVRGLEKVREIAVGGAIASVTQISLNIVFLLPLRMGLLGYFLATIISSVVQTVYLMISAQLWKNVSLGCCNSRLESEMRAYGVPMMVNSVAWWANNVSDRYVVTLFCGIAENGIYAVSTKIPSILNVLQGIFNQAWVLSAVKDIDHEDSDGFFRKTYNAYGCLMVLVCSALIVIDRPLARFLYISDFYAAWRFAPFLMIAMVFGALCGHLGGVYAAAMDSKMYARSTAVGAVFNIAANFAMVPVFGAMGAAWATALSYWFIWVMRRRSVDNYVTIDFSLRRDYASYLLLVIQGFVLLAMPDEHFGLYFIQASALFAELILYRSELAMWKSLVLQLFRRITDN